MRAASAVHFVHVPKNPSPPHAVICLRAHNWAEFRRCDELARNITCQHASHSRGVAFCSKSTCADRTRYGSHVQRGISFSRRVKRTAYQIHKYILILLDSLILVRPVLLVSTDNTDGTNSSLVLLLFIQVSIRKLMMLTFLLLLPFILPRAFGCPQHENHIAPLHNNGQIMKPTSTAHSPPYWSYDASYDWGRLSPDYALCQIGTNQSPVALWLNEALSSRRRPDFTGYKPNATGEYYNWGYGPAFTFYHGEGDYSGLPTIEVDNQTLYMKGWHIHAPSDHVVDSKRSRAELHLVQYVRKVDS